MEQIPDTSAHGELRVCQLDEMKIALRSLSGQKATTSAAYEDLDVVSTGKQSSHPSPSRRSKTILKIAAALIFKFSIFRLSLSGSERVSQRETDSQSEKDPWTATHPGKGHTP